jgi:lipoprotein-anchoring transpeptidase ErfK/SrfK
MVGPNPLKAGMIHKFTRRGLLLGGITLVASGCIPVAQESLANVSFGYRRLSGVSPRYRRRRVRYDGRGESGTIVVDTSSRFLYFVEGDGWATRYGVGVGQEGLSLKGSATIGRKAVWPSWTPTANMMRRKPHLVQYAGGLPGGINNPLGARALYLYRGGKDTMFRLHGTNEPWSIGQAVSSGCVRLLNDDIVHLYDRTRLGTPVLVI